MNKVGFRLTTLFHIPINISYTWFIILGLIVFSLASTYFPYTNPELDVYAHCLMAFIAALLLFASLLAHELSHSLVARHYNLPINGITLFVFGGVAHLGKEPESPDVEFKMALAGPLMSFCLAAIFLLFNTLFTKLAVPSAILSITTYLVMINLMVGMLNLIPGFPLDGGRILRATIWALSHNFKKATAIASSLGKAFAVLLMAGGLLSLYNALFLSGIWLIFIGLFLFEAADNSYKQLNFNDILTKLKLSDIIVREVITVSGEISLDKLIDNYFFHYRHHSFPVMSKHDVLGLITLHEVKSIPRDKWSSTLAREVMLPLTTDLYIGENTKPLVALTKMASNRVGRLLVIENNRLQGIISQRDVMSLFEFKAEIEG